MLERFENEKEQRTKMEEKRLQRAQSLEQPGQQQQDSNGFHSSRANHQDNNRSQPMVFVVGGGTASNGIDKTTSPSHHFDRR